MGSRILGLLPLESTSLQGLLLQTRSLLERDLLPVRAAAVSAQDAWSVFGATLFRNIKLRYMRPVAASSPQAKAERSAGGQLLVIGKIALRRSCHHDLLLTCTRRGARGML